MTALFCYRQHFSNLSHVNKSAAPDREFLVTENTQREARETNSGGAHMKSRVNVVLLHIPDCSLESPRKILTPPSYLPLFVLMAGQIMQLTWGKLTGKKWSSDPYMGEIHRSMTDFKERKAKWGIYVILDWGGGRSLRFQREVKQFTGRWKE